MHHSDSHTEASSKGRENFHGRFILVPHSLVSQSLVPHNLSGVFVSDSDAVGVVGIDNWIDMLSTSRFNELSCVDDFSVSYTFSGQAANSINVGPLIVGV